MANWASNYLTLHGDPAFITDLHARFAAAPQEDAADGWATVLAEMVTERGYKATVERYPFHTQMELDDKQLDGSARITLNFETKWEHDMSLIHLAAHALPLTFVELAVEETGDEWLERYSWANGVQTSAASGTMVRWVDGENLDGTIAFVSETTFHAGGKRSRKTQWEVGGEHVTFEAVGAALLTDEYVEELSVRVEAFDKAAALSRSNGKRAAVLRELASNPSQLVCLAVASHPATPARSRSAAITSVLCDPEVEEAQVVEMLAAQTDQQIRAWAASLRTTHPALWDLRELPREMFLATARPAMAQSASVTAEPAK